MVVTDTCWLVSIWAELEVSLFQYTTCKVPYVPNYIPVIYQPARIRWEQTAVSGVIINTIATALPVCMQKVLNLYHNYNMVCLRRSTGQGIIFQSDHMVPRHRPHGEHALNRQASLAYIQMRDEVHMLCEHSLVPPIFQILGCGSKNYCGNLLQYPQPSHCLSPTL